MAKLMKGTGSYEKLKRKGNRAWVFAIRHVIMLETRFRKQLTLPI